MQKKKYRCCLITGASSGLGRETAFLMKERAQLLILLGQNAQELQLVAEECKKNTSNGSLEVMIYPGDLCDNNYFQAVLDLFKMHPIDLLINNAGAGLYGKALDFPLPYQEQLFQLNGWIPLHLTYHAFQAWQKENKPGTVVQVGSALAFITSPYSATYAAAKSFLVQWSLALSEELKGSSQKIIVFCPGMIKTPFRKKASQDRDLHLEGLEIKEAASLLVEQLEKGQLLQITPLKDRLLLSLARFFPLKWSLKLLGKKLSVRA